MLWLSQAVRQRPGRFVFAAALLLALGLALRPQHADAPTAGDAAVVTHAAARGEPAVATESTRSASAASTASNAATTSAWPDSLRDSEPDGAVTLDALGQVQPSIELRRLFDYFLSALGERDVAAIRALLLAHVRERHGDAIAAQVAALFDRYVDYQQALAAMNAPPGEALRERLERVRDLRRRLLDAAMAEAFFGDEERYTEYVLDRRDTLADRSLDEVERDRRLQEIDASLAPEQRTQMQEANTALLVDEQNRQFDALRLDPAERQAEREALFGREAAQRLAAADAEQAAWDARVAAYVRARNAIRADARLDATARDRAITALRARSFDAAEQRRVASLEAIGQL